VLRAALHQVVVHPTASPTLNDGGWVYNAALLLFVLGALLLLLIVFGYMRLAPRFQTEEGARKSVRAPRIQPGKDTRRPVNVTGTPLAVEPRVAMATVHAGRLIARRQLAAPHRTGWLLPPTSTTPPSVTPGAATRDRHARGTRPSAGACTCRW
jgi:hypothetical protein